MGATKTIHRARGGDGDHARAVVVQRPPATRQGTAYAAGAANDGAGDADVNDCDDGCYYGDHADVDAHGEANLEVGESALEAAHIAIAQCCF